MLYHMFIDATCNNILIPRPAPFSPSDTQEQNTDEKQGRSGSIHHMSRCAVDVGGEGPIFKQDLKNIKNVKRCRDGMPKSMQTR